MRAWRRAVLLLPAGLVAVGLGGAVAAEGLADLVEPYLRIHASLASDTLEGVSAAAKALAALAAQLPEGGALQAGARELAAAGDLKAARAAFGKLSDALIRYATATKQPWGEGVRVAYCPMVKQSWVQKGDEIANPYYGQQMLRCGEFQKR